VGGVRARAVPRRRDRGPVRGAVGRAALAGTALGRAALAVAVVGGHTVQAVSSSLPTFLVEHRALDTGGFGAVRTVSLLLSALGSAVTGALADAGG
jgi:hypothetical protein